jgi:hypothetical protein
MPEHEPVTEPLDEQDEWLEDPEELPPRPRRRLLGTGANPIFLALLAVLAIACGFIGGVLVEKGQTSSGSAGGATSGLASRFAALRGGTSSTGARSGAAGAAGAAGSLFGGGAGAGRPTSGTVAYLAGSTLYITNAEGNTVKVKTSAGTNVTKNVKASVSGIHPGETVTVTGAAAANGTVNAESISVGSSGGALSALFGGSGARSSSGKAGSSSGSGGGSSGGGGEQSLFGGG